MAGMANAAHASFGVRYAWKALSPTRAARIPTVPSAATASHGVSEPAEAARTREADEEQDAPDDPTETANSKQHDMSSMKAGGQPRGDAA